MNKHLRAAGLALVIGASVVALEGIAPYVEPQEANAVVQAYYAEMATQNRQAADPGQRMENLLEDLMGRDGISCVYYEDGSGFCHTGKRARWETEHREGNVIAVFEENTFPWDCKTMGNEICG